MAAIFIAGIRREHAEGDEALRITADDYPPVTLCVGDSIEITGTDDVGIQISCFKKGDPPQLKWSKWPDWITRWIKFNPIRQ